MRQCSSEAAWRRTSTSRPRRATTLALLRPLAVEWLFCALSNVVAGSCYRTACCSQRRNQFSIYTVAASFGFLSFRVRCFVRAWRTDSGERAQAKSTCKHATSWASADSMVGRRTLGRAVRFRRLPVPGCSLSDKVLTQFWHGLALE